jgi:hypothetical protein
LLDDVEGEERAMGVWGVGCVSIARDGEFPVSGATLWEPVAVLTLGLAAASAVAASAVAAGWAGGVIAGPMT